MTRSANSWQLILADLALILFLVSLIALIGRKDERLAEQAILERRGERAILDEPPQITGVGAIAPAHGLYRPSAAAPPISEWLTAQALDSRAVLTIHALHKRGQEQIIWNEAQALAQGAQAANVKFRIVLEEAERNDLSATLAFDAAPEAAKASS